MSNNMYDILGKLNGLAPKQEAPKPTQPLYESVEARGSIVAGVKSVEQKLREQYEAAKQVEEGSHYGNEKLANARASRTGTSTVRDQNGKGGVKTTTTKTPVDKAAGNVAKEDRETLKTKHGTIYKGGTYGNADYDSEAGGASNAPKPTRGRPAAGKDRVAKVAKVRGPKGRPKKNAVGPTGGNAPKGDIFGRTTGDVPMGKKGTVVKGKANVDETSNPFAIGMGQAKKEVGLGRSKKLGESRDPSTSDYTYETVGRRLAQENPHMDTNSDLFFDAVYDECVEIGMSPKAARNLLNYNEDFLSDAASAYAHFAKTQESRGPSFAPQHPGAPAPVAKPGFMDKAKAFGQKALNTLGHGSDEELKAKLQRDIGMQEDAQLDELARLAGLQVSEANDGNLANNAKPYDKVTRGDVVAGRLGKDEQGGKVDEADCDMEEGNEFSGALAKAKASGEKQFNVDGKSYTVKEDAQLDECGDMSPIGSMANDMQQQQGRISVNTNSSSDGTKSVSINADGEAAEQLMAMLKMAGMGNSQAHAQQAQIVIAHEAKAYGDTDVAEPEEYANSPQEKVSSMRQSPTTGLAGGTDDLNKSKDQDPATANKAANPKAKVEKQLEDANPLDSLGAKLMAEYQGIKLQK